MPLVIPTNRISVASNLGSDVLCKFSYPSLLSGLYSASDSPTSNVIECQGAYDFCIGLEAPILIR